jgi:hypothetical protein
MIMRRVIAVLVAAAAIVLGLTAAQAQAPTAAACCAFIPGNSISVFPATPTVNAAPTAATTTCRVYLAAVRTSSNNVDLFVEAITANGVAWTRMDEFVYVTDNTNAQQPMWETDFTNLTGSSFQGVLHAPAGLAHHYQLQVGRYNASDVYQNEMCFSNTVLVGAG